MWKMWQPKNLNEAQLPMLIIAWICGYGVIQHPLNNFGITFSLVYSVFISSIYLTCFYFAFMYFTSIDWPRHEDKFFLVFIAVQFFFIGVNFVKEWIHRRTLAEVYKRNIAVEKILEFLGSPVNLHQALKSSILTVFFWFVFSVLSNILMIIWFRQNIPFFKGLLAISVLQHPIHVNEIIDMNFVITIRHIRLRLKSVNQILSNLNSVQNDNWIRRTNDMSSKNVSFSSQFFRKDITKINLSSISHDSMPSTADVFQIIKCLHLEIKVLSKKVMSIYGLSLIITMIITFTMITYSFYALYLSMWNPTVFQPDRTFKSFVVIMSIVGYNIKLITINYVCAKTAFEYRKTGEIIHQLNIQPYDLDVRNKIQQFCIQLMHHPLVFSPCGLIQLGFPFIRDFAGSLTTYLIILIQINDSIPKSK